MKTSDGFDARRLRPKGQGNWPKRIGILIALLLAVSGALLTVAGVSSLVGHPQMLGELNASPGGAAFVAVSGLLVFCLGVWLWRRCRRQRSASGLSISAHLMKKHN
jgi:ABC-type nickel/cobalt efflux system permease component RcnA